MDRIQVGYVARPHGVNGELRVQTHDPGSTVLSSVDRIWIGDREHKILQVRPTNNAFLITIAGCSDRDAAEALKGQIVEVPRAEIPLAEGEYLLADLPGCQVVDLSGAPLGVVHEVMTGAQPILVIRDENLERLLPAVPGFVHAVDVAARRVVVELPEDLPAEPYRR
jgi:16S rRNA processing protein RimM